MRNQTKGYFLLAGVIIVIFSLFILGAFAVFANEWFIDTSNGMEEATACQNGRDLIIDGNLSFALYSKWVTLLNANAQKDQLRLFLNSPGGNVKVAESIAKHVKAFGITTILPANSSCNSACPLIFIESDKRIADPTAILRFHQTVFSVFGLRFPAPWDTRVEDAMEKFPVSSKRLADTGAWASSEFKSQTAERMEAYDPGFATIIKTGPMPACSIKPSS